MRSLRSRTTVEELPPPPVVEKPARPFRNNGLQLQESDLFRPAFIKEFQDQLPSLQGFHLLNLNTLAASLPELDQCKVLPLMCDNQIGPTYVRRNCKGCLVEPDTFDMVYILERPVESINSYDDFVNCAVGVILSEKGECQKFPTTYSVNLICSPCNKGQFLLGLFIYCIMCLAEEGVPQQAVLELAGGYTNAGGLCMYQKFGFQPDVANMFDPKNGTCFHDLLNLPMMSKFEVFGSSVAERKQNVIKVIAGTYPLPKHEICSLRQKQLQMVVGMCYNLQDYLTYGQLKLVTNSDSRYAYKTLYKEIEKVAASRQMASAPNSPAMVEQFRQYLLAKEPTAEQQSQKDAYIVQLYNMVYKEMKKPAKRMPCVDRVGVPMVAPAPPKLMVPPPSLFPSAAVPISPGSGVTTAESSPATSPDTSPLFRNKRTLRADAEEGPSQRRRYDEYVGGRNRKRTRKIRRRRRIR